MTTSQGEHSKSVEQCNLIAAGSDHATEYTVTALYMHLQMGSLGKPFECNGKWYISNSIDC